MTIVSNTPLGLSNTLASHPGLARGWPAQRKVQAGFAFALVCLALVGIASYASVKRLRTNADWGEHTHQVLTQLDRLLLLTMEAETAERGYVITGDEGYLATYTAAAVGTSEVERELVRLTRDNSGQGQQLDRLSGLITTRLAALRDVDEARRTVGFSAAQELVQSGPGKRIHSDLEQQIDQIAQAERSLLRERQQRVDRDIAITVAIGIVGSLLGVACVAWAARVSRRDYAERNRIEEQREALKLSLAAQLEDTRRLQALNSRLIVVHELPKMLEEILDATVELQQADLGNIQLYDPQSATLSIVAQRGFSQAFLDHFRVVSAGEPSACGRVLQSRSRVIIEDVETDAEYGPHRAAAAEAGYRGVQSTPIFGRDGREVAACDNFALSDPTLLGQILRNLLSNAIRYTRNGSVRLRCDREGDKLRLSVSDTGIGIAKDHLRDIFEEFYQVGVPANTVREGHGLGLNIVKRVAQLLNHPMQVDSELGKGSAFSILMPTASAENRTQKTTQVLPSGTPPRHKAHVLLVDDDHAVLDATRLLLKVEGYRVSVALTFEAAMDKVRENPDIELLVTDFHLGDGRLGTEVARHVTEALGRVINTVLITGDTSSAMRSIAEGSHIRLASKPIKADEFLLVLREQSETPPGLGDGEL